MDLTKFLLDRSAGELANQNLNRPLQPSQNINPSFDKTRLSGLIVDLIMEVMVNS